MNEEEKIFFHEKTMPKEVENILSYMDLEDNNIDGKVAHLRDTFLSAEREYVMELLRNKEIRRKIIQYNIYSSEQLYAVAQDIVEKVENNLIPYEEMERQEQILTILLAAIQDKVLRKVLSILPSEEISYGRSR